MITPFDRLLERRGASYGNFAERAEVSQAIKRAMATGRNWPTLADDQRDCLEMVAVKLSRILHGDKDHVDSWQDCVGYFKLVADRVTMGGAHGEAEERATDQGGAT